jgi:hypothetical protein
LEHFDKKIGLAAASLKYLRDAAQEAGAA